MSNEDKITVTAVFEDKKRKRYKIEKSASAEKFVNLILSDRTIEKPSQNLCLVKEGHILEANELLYSSNGPKEFSLNIVFNPILGNGRNRRFPNALFGFADEEFGNANAIVLDERADEQLAELFPEIFGQNEGLLCGVIGFKKFMIGLIVGTVSGPLAFIVLPCYDFDISGILGISVGVIIWVILFLLLATTRKHNTNNSSSSNTSRSF